jgi:hypothetical protein
MDLTSWLGLIAGLGGAAVATYGVVALLTGRLTRGDRRAFRSTKEGGLYYLCFGLALALVAVSGVANARGWPWLAVVGIIGTLVFVGLAATRYRPRRGARRSTGS